MSTSTESAPYGLGKKEGVQFFRKPTVPGPPMTASRLGNDWTISLVMESLEAQSTIYQQFYSTLGHELKILPSLTQHAVNNADVIVIPCDNSWGLQREGTLCSALMDMIGNNLARSVKDYIFTMYFGEQPSGSSFLLCFNGVYICWTCTSRTKEILSKSDFAFNTIWSALSTINQFNLTVKQAREKGVLKKVLIPEFSQFCDSKEEQIQIALAIKQWLSKDCIEIDNEKEAEERNKTIIDPMSSVMVSIEKEMEGLIWSRDIEKRGLCNQDELDCLVRWINSKKGSISISCCEALVSILELEDTPYTLPRQVIVNRIFSPTHGCLSRIIDVHNEIMMETLEIRQKIGEGATSTVSKGYWNGREVAIKSLLYKNSKEFKREVSLLSLLRHRNIVMCYGANVEHFFMVEELLLTSLFALLHQESVPLDLFQRLMFAEGAARGMKYLHSCGIIHRDLKSLNILISSDLEAKLCDFGLSRMMDDAAMTRSIGTVAWIAPEVLTSKGDYTEKADVYSFAIIVWELYTRKQPYSEHTSFNIPIIVAKGERPPIDKTCPADWKSLIVKCWNKRPQSRPTFSMIVKFIRQMKITHAAALTTTTRKKLAMDDGKLVLENTGQLYSVYDHTPSTECSDPKESSLPASLRFTSESSLSSSIGGLLGPQSKRKLVKSVGSSPSNSFGTSSSGGQSIKISEVSKQKERDFAHGHHGSPSSARREKSTSFVDLINMVGDRTSSSNLSSTVSVSGLDSERT